MAAYDRSFNPPAPVVDVVVAHPLLRSRRSTIRGKMDTGADVSVIPERFVHALRLNAKSRIWTRGYDGTFAQRPVYYVRLSIEGFVVRTARCIATNRTDVLLGRNVLNRFHIILDGKSLNFELSDPQ